MDIQRAIHVLEDCVDAAKGTEFAQVYQMAISALQEQAEREKGCEFCGPNGDRIIEAFGDGWMKVVNAAGHFAAETEDNDATTNLFFNIEYCPMCGKRLK